MDLVDVFVGSAGADTPLEGQQAVRYHDAAVIEWHARLRTSDSGAQESVEGVWTEHREIVTEP